MSSVVELHPEELLDREGRGELSEGERRRLEAHRAHCVACRIEQGMRADFAAELETDDDIPLPNLAGLLAGASIPAGERSSGEGDPASPLAREILAREIPARDLPVEPPSVILARSSGLRKWRRAALLLVAAALLVVSAAAGVGARTKTWLRLVTSTFAQDSAQPPGSSEGASGKPGHVAAARGTTGTSVGLVDDGVGDVVAAAAVVTPAVLSAPAAPVSPIAPAGGATDVPEARAPDARVRSAVQAPGALPRRESTALFDAERSARLRGDYSRVLELHQDLVARYPRSREAQASRATVGQLLLDRGDPSGALASFDAYSAARAGGLEGTEELSEVVLAGRATALDRLGRTDEARRAWRALLVAFPDTPYARHATARLEESSVP